MKSLTTIASSIAPFLHLLLRAHNKHITWKHVSYWHVLHILQRHGTMRPNAQHIDAVGPSDVVCSHGTKIVKKKFLQLQQKDGFNP